MADAKVTESEIKWRPWSKEAFDEARAQRKLILLDLSASWCHWCHVMDETTYSDKDVVLTINESFIPVRVDIDKRPDISERYNRGGFPTTAFLSDQGESVWGGTYIPPEDMKRVMKALIESKASGEIDSALERERQQFLDLSKALERREHADDKLVDLVFEDIFSTYDVQQGGFGIEPKFPHPEVVDMLLFQFQRTKDRAFAEAVASTLDHMTKGLYDNVDGGVYRYSVTRDWNQPHYEKMLETNLGFLRNLTRAFVELKQERFAATARGVANYLIGTLRDPKDGGFYSSQDADEEYYLLSTDKRKKARPPKVIKDKFAGWNCDAVTVFSETGVLLHENAWIDAAKEAWNFVLRVMWNPEKKLVRHAATDETYLFDDQVSFLEASLTMIEFASADEIPEMLDLMDGLIGATDRTFKHLDGGFGDIAPSPGAIGELAESRRSLPANSRWARAFALSGAAAFKPERTSTSLELLNSFPPKEVQSNGLFAAGYVRAWWSLARGPRAIEIHGAMARDHLDIPLWLEAKTALDQSAVVMEARRQTVEIGIASQTPFAVICTASGCSPEITDPGELRRRLSEQAI